MVMRRYAVSSSGRSVALHVARDNTMPRCQVGVTGSDGRIEHAEVEATSVFDVGYQANATVCQEVVAGRLEAALSGGTELRVRPGRLREWRRQQLRPSTNQFG
jgi:hypothetical protein